MLQTAFLMTLLTVASPAPVDTVVVCPVAFREALTPWLEYRTYQGHRIAVVPSDGPAEEIRRAIVAQAAGGKLRFVLIAGDTVTPGVLGSAGRAVPTFAVPAHVNVAWGSEAEIGTDNGYGDLDGDGVPELAVGRIPAASPAELRAILGRTIAYETSREFGPWRLSSLIWQTAQLSRSAVIEPPNLLRPRRVSASTGRNACVASIS